jgi:hypothetical protein
MARQKAELKERLQPISLFPLTPKEAIEAFLETKPKDEEKKRKKPSQESNHK